MPAFTQTFLTDKLDRLTSFTASNLTEIYSYDLTGNRVTLAIGANSYRNTIAATGNRLSSTSGPAPMRTNTFDAAGNLTGDGTRTTVSVYDEQGHLLGE